MAVNRPRFIDRLKTGFSTLVNGPPSPYLSPEEQAAASAQRRMAMTATLLRSSAPTPQGTGPGAFGALGAALESGGAAQSDAVQNAMRARVIQAQLAGGQDRMSAAIGDMKALGYPLTKEGFAAYNRDKGSDSPVSDQLAMIQAQLGIDQRRDQLARDRAADERTAEENRVKKVELGNTLNSGLTQTADLANLTEKLEGSFLAAGMPASSWRRTGASVLAGAGAALGMDTRELEGDIANFDRLKKGLSDQLINLMSNGDLTRGTNQILQQYQNALATNETSPGAIMSIQAGIARTLLDEADAKGVTVRDREAIESNIKKWKHYESPQSEAVVDVPGAARSAADVARMTAEQLRALDPGQMTQEVLDAAKKRWEELHNARQ
jgi:hypothetical protein